RSRRPAAASPSCAWSPFRSARRRRKPSRSRPSPRLRRPPRPRRPPRRRMFSWLTNAWRVPELRKRVLFTGLILAIYRFGSWMPAPGVNSDQISKYFNGKGGTVLGLLNLFSGSALSRFSIFALAVLPSVTPSFVLQLLTL